MSLPKIEVLLQVAVGVNSSHYKHNLKVMLTVTELGITANIYTEYTMAPSTECSGWQLVTWNNASS